MWWRKKRGERETDWRQNVAELAQQAQVLAGNGEMEQASQLVSAAFAIVDSDGTEKDAVFLAPPVARHLAPRLPHRSTQ